MFDWDAFAVRSEERWQAAQPYILACDVERVRDFMREEYWDYMNGTESLPETVEELPGGWTVEHYGDRARRADKIAKRLQQRYIDACPDLVRQPGLERWGPLDVTLWFCEEGIINLLRERERKPRRRIRWHDDLLRWPRSHVLTALCAHGVAQSVNGLFGFNFGPRLSGIYEATVRPDLTRPEAKIVDAAWLGRRPDKCSLRGLKRGPLALQEFEKRRNTAIEQAAKRQRRT